MRTKHWIYFLIILGCSLSLSGCALLQLPLQLVQIPFQILGQAYKLFNALPKPPPGVVPYMF